MDSRLVRNLPAWLTVLAVLLAAWVWSSPAQATDLKSALKALGSEDTDKLMSAIDWLGNSGDPAALPILQAYRDETLRTAKDGRVFILSKDGKQAQDPVSQETLPAERLQLASPFLSNMVRRALGPAIAGLALVSPEVSVRAGAARELAKRASPEDASRLRAALSRETNPDIRNTLLAALARLDLNSPDRALKLAAIKLVEAEGDVQLKVDLLRLTATKEDGSFAEPDAAIRAAAVSAMKAMDQRQMFVNLFANLLYGLSLGSVLLLTALGLAITFGLMGIINMAHGEMLMIGAYTAYSIQNLFKSAFPGAFDYYVLAALPAAFLVCAAVGVLLERGVLRFLYGRALESLLATWGISLILIQIVRLVFGAQNVTVANPAWLTGGWVAAPGLVLPWSRIFIVLLGLIVVAGVSMLLQRTALGLQVRAVTQNRAMAAAMGVRTARVDMWTFAFGSGIAGIGGVALSQLGNVGPELGQSYIVDSFMVVVLGGVGKITGSIAGAMGLGILAKYLEPFTDAVLGKIILLALIVLFIQKRPQGLFALKGRAVEG
jgi:urea transport system permease protein